MAIIPWGNERLSALHQFISRDELKGHDHKNWAHANPGVILVFCLVACVVLGLILVFCYRFYLRKQAERAAYETE